MKYLKILAIAITFYSLSAQADSNCWSAGVLDGMCYQSTSTTQQKVNYLEPQTSDSACWSAGVLDGMCIDSTSSDYDTQKSLDNSSDCWTAGVLNGMCY